MDNTSDDFFSFGGAEYVLGELYRRYIFAERTDDSEIIRATNIDLDLTVPIVVITASEPNPKWKLFASKFDRQLFVFVLIPRDLTRPIEYFIATREEIHQMREAFEVRKIGFSEQVHSYTVSPHHLTSHAGAWAKINNCLNLPRRD